MANNRKNWESGFLLGSEDNPTVAMANTIELIGFISEQERHFPAANADNFNGMVKFDDSGKLFYRLVMPIAKLPVRNSKGREMVQCLYFSDLNMAIPHRHANRERSPDSQNQLNPLRLVLQCEDQDYSGSGTSDLQLQSSFYSFISLKFFRPATIRS